MIYGLETPVFIGRVLLVILAITTTAFPALYWRSPWYRSRLGRAVMIQAIALCLAVWLKVLLTFFLNEDHMRTFLLWLNVIFILAMIVATSKLTYVQWMFLHKEREKENA